MGCACGCNTCHKSPLLNEAKQYDAPISENLRYHIDNKIPLNENIFRAGSNSHINLLQEARNLWNQNIIELQDLDKRLFEHTDLGRIGVYEGKIVPLDLPLMEIETEPEFNVNKVWDFIESKPFYNKSYTPMFNTAEEIWSEWGPKEKELYSNFEWKDTYSGEIHPREKMTLKKRQTYKNLTEAQMLDGYEVDFFHTKANVYANIEIPSENPTFEDNIQIKGTGKNEEEAFKDLQQNYKNYKKTGINEAEKKNPPLGKPKRGGSKKFYVYVRDPKTKNIKKVSFGQVGMSAKINDPKARQAFAKRHKCAQKTDKTKPSYWSCRLPRYAKLLGLKSTFSGFW
jgi:hypothetical protein